MSDERECRFVDVCPFVGVGHRDEVRGEAVAVLERKVIELRRENEVLGIQWMKISDLLGFRVPDVKDEVVSEAHRWTPDEMIETMRRVFKERRLVTDIESANSRCEQPDLEHGDGQRRSVARGDSIEVTFAGWVRKDSCNWWENGDMRVWSRKVGVGDSRIAVEQWYSERGVTDQPNGPFDTPREAIEAVERVGS